MTDEILRDCVAYMNPDDPAENEHYEYLTVAFDRASAEVRSVAYYPGYSKTPKAGIPLKLFLNTLGITLEDCAKALYGGESDDEEA